MSDKARRLPRILSPLLLLAVLPGCASVQQLLSGQDAAERLAAQVTITRDEWGVPHIHGESDAATVFGHAWAQAEDAFAEIEENYIRALGRAAEWHGESRIADDLVRAAFEVVRLSREEYAREPPERRQLWDAWAAGLNHYVRTTGVQPRLITRFEPWMPFALMRDVHAGMLIDGVRLGGATAGDGATPGGGGAYTTVGVWEMAGGEPSSAPSAVGPDAASAGAGAAAGSPGVWAVAPGRTADGHALLVQSRHVSFVSGAQPLEVHLRSESGWHVRGIADPGVPLPTAGHNERLAWAHTDSPADRADVYAVAFDAADPLMYGHDDAWRRATEWQDTLFVNTAQGVMPRVVRFRRTHHGPVVAQREGRALAMRIARMEDGGSLQQWLAMGRARDLEQFRAALEQRALPGRTTTYADADGNILHVRGSAVPARDSAFDWTQPVAGNTSATEWRDYRALSELPQVLNPTRGWIGAETHAHAGGLLSADSALTLDAAARVPFATRVSMAEDEILALAQEWEDVGGRNPARARPLDEVVDTLRTWDHDAAAGSTAATLFILWQERLRSGGYNGDLIRFRALEDVMARLQRDWQTAFVEWGAVQRLQRSRDGSPFSDEAPSVAMPGAPGWTGAVFAVSGSQPSGTRLRYATAGAGWVSVTELGPSIRSRSVVAFGQSANPASPHYFDQAELFVRGDLKPSPFTKSEVEAHARATYRPQAAGQ